MTVDREALDLVDSLGMRGAFNRVWARFEQRRRELGVEAAGWDAHQLALLCAIWQSYRRMPSEELRVELRLWAAEWLLVPYDRRNLGALDAEGLDAELRRIFEGGAK